MKIKELSKEEKVGMSGPMFKIVDKREFWHRPTEYPKLSGDIFYKSKKYNDYRIENFYLDRFNIVSYYDEWMQFIKREEVEKWCYLRDLVDIIDNDDFVSGELYLIKHI